MGKFVYRLPIWMFLIIVGFLLMLTPACTIEIPEDVKNSTSFSECEREVDFLVRVQRYDETVIRASYAYCREQMPDGPYYKGD